MDSTNDQTNYVIKDAICSGAIETFKETTLISEWVSKQKELYNSIVYGPEGLPKIIDCHFEGERFDNTQRFRRLYEMIQSLFTEQAFRRAKVTHNKWKKSTTEKRAYHF